METTGKVIVSPALQERMIEGAGVKRVFKINVGQASYHHRAIISLAQPPAVAQAICSGGATKRAIHWRLSERYLAIWRMCEIPVLPRMRGQSYARDRISRTAQGFASTIGASEWKRRR